MFELEMIFILQMLVIVGNKGDVMSRYLLMAACPFGWRNLNCLTLAIACLGPFCGKNKDISIK